MKLHKSLVGAIVDALKEIFEEKHLADKTIEKILKSNKKWGARDRAFIAENTYEIVRWYRLLSDFFQDKNEINFWQIFALWWLKTHTELPDWPEFEGLNTQDVIQYFEKEETFPRKIQESIPDWLDQLGETELGTLAWNTELKALNNPTKTILRVNSLKISKEALIEKLTEKGVIIATNEKYPDALILEKRTNLMGLDEYKSGFFEIQDAGSQAIAPFLDVEPNMTVIDACAGAGGKTLHLASLMQNKGNLVAMDIETKKLKVLQQRGSRNGVKILKECVLANQETLGKYKDSADRLLLDVPCSGLGVLRRNPDAKWKLSLEFVEKIKVIQAKIIQEYAVMVKPNGKMVYATCSILPSESEQQVELFLVNNKNWVLESQQRTSPAKDGFDGFYMARLKRIK